MKAADCTLKTRVGFITYYGAVSRGSIIVEPTAATAGAAEIAVVEWDNGSVQKIDVSTLIPEAEVAAEEERLAKEKLRLEEEFAIVAAQVKVKADAAAALINEAQALAETIHKEARYMGDACDLLQDALDSSGWYQSSYSC